MGQFIVSARKYRPNSFETLLGQENIARTLKNSILRDQLAHAYLFCGPRGVGKTSAARIFAKIINCSNPGPDLEPCGECESCRSFAEGRSYSIHELDAASNNSVEDIRALTEKVRIPPQIGKYSVYIIDEVHMLSQAAFNAFLKTLEEPPQHAIFILATTEKHKILPTILSRCQTYDFNRISIDDMVRQMKVIAAQEQIDISEDAMHIIAQKADGAMRDALTLFDQTVAFCGKQITYEQVIQNLNVLDYEYYFSLTENFLAGDYAKALVTFDEILSKGFNALGFISGLSTHFRDLMVCKQGASENLLLLAPTIAARYRSFARQCQIPFLFEALSISSACEAGYKQSGNPRLLIEFALMKLCNINGALSQGVAQAAPKPAAAAPQSAPARPAPAPEPVQAPAPAPTPAPAAPKKSVRSSSGLSIKELMAEAEKEDEPVAAASADAAAPSAASLQDAWHELAAMQTKPNLASALSHATPRMEGNEIHFEVGNAAQKEWIDRNCRARFEAFLQHKLGNARARLFVDVAKAESLDTSLYMPSDKVKHLQDSSQNFRDLQKEFSLETS